MSVRSIDLDSKKKTVKGSPSSQPARHKIVSWLAQHKLLVYGSALIILILAAGATIYLQASRTPSSSVATSPTSTPAPAPTPTPEIPSIPNPLNGQFMTKDQANRVHRLRPLAVMVENHLESRPQSGINQADLVYEALAEGGITRLMPVYLLGRPDKIGPVRSARMHFISWATEYQSLYAHWGGSPESKEYLATHSNPYNLDQFFNPTAFYRDNSSNRSLEHTGYTSTNLLRQLAVNKGWEQPAKFDSWRFKDDAPQDQRPDHQTVSANMLGTAGYQISFTYQPSTNSYLRSTGGRPHLDDKGKQWRAKTIIFQIQPLKSFNRPSGKAAIDLTTTGSGSAVIIQDGQSTEGRWYKPSLTARTTFTDNQGQPISLNRGKIWIISIPQGSSYAY